mgnify:CR=1 FL=1
MNTTINPTTSRASDQTTALISIMAVALLGAALLFAAGFAQSATLHDAAHDVRHATGFPCH